MTMIKPEPLSHAARDVLGQLLMSGPVWDGNILCKAGRTELVDRGLAFRCNGFQSLTEDGLRIALEWTDFANPEHEVLAHALAIKLKR